MYILTLLVTTAYALPELPNDGIDQDGDGGDAIRQNFRANFTSAPWASTSGWGATGGASFANDVATIPSMGRIDWTGVSAYNKGDLYLVVDADSLTGSCTGLVEYTSGGTPYGTTFALVAGTNAYTITTASPLLLQHIRFSCALFGSAEIDWAVAQNGTVLFAPPGDIDVAWEDVDKPGAGYINSMSVRGVYPDGPPFASMLLASLDVGGIAFYNMFEAKWVVRNGEWPDMLQQSSELAMHDVLMTSDGEVVALSGEIDLRTGCSVNATTECVAMVVGRLMVTSDEGASWLAEADSYQTPGAGTPGVAANRRISPFVTGVANGNATWQKTLAAGRLLENAGSSVFVANHIPKVGTIGGFPALALREHGTAGAPADICALTNPAFPELELPAPEYDAELGWSNVISSLAWIGEPWYGTLLVGYRQRDRAATSTSGNPEDSSLWRCDMPVGPSPDCAAYETDLECYPIAEGVGLDVSDIELTLFDGQYYAWVGDYGYQNESGTCDSADPNPTCVGVISTPGVWRWEVDLLDPTGTLDTVTDVSGSVGVDLHAVSGVMADNDYLYAFIPYGVDAWYSKSPRHWRIPLVDAMADTGDWNTLSEENQVPVGEEERDAYFTSTDTWADDQEAKSSWASVTDGVRFWDWIVGSGGMALWGFVGMDNPDFDGQGPEDDTASPDTADWGLDDDELLTSFEMFDRADGAGSTTFQGTVDVGLAYAPDGRLHVASGDIVYYRQDVSGRGVAPPQTELFNAEPSGIAVAETSAGEGQAAVWLIVATDAEGAGQGVFRSDDNGETFCYQADQDFWIVNTDPAYDVKFVGSRYDLTELEMGYGSSVSGFPDWPACDNDVVGAELAGMALSPFGKPARIEALDENVAVIAFIPKGFDTSGDAIHEPGGLAYTLDGSVTWHATTGAPAGVFDDTPTMDLVTRKSEYNSPTDWMLELIYANNGVGVYRVVIEAATAPAATWTFLDLSGCPQFDQGVDENADHVYGVVANPWADTFVAYGSWSTTPPASNFGGACLSNLDGSNASELIDPDDPNFHFKIMSMAPHPFLLNTWFVAPMVQQFELTTCIRTYDDSPRGWDYDWGGYFDACGAPFPRVVQRNGGQWRSDPLSVAGLPSLKGMGVAARQDGAAVEIAYATGGSGSFRGMLTW